MSDFEKFLLNMGVPISDVVSPLERLLLRLKIISKPIGMFSYPKRAIWYSFIFMVLYLCLGELALRLFLGTTISTMVASIPRKELFLAVMILVSFGPLSAFVSIRAMKKHRDILQSYQSEE